MAVTLKRVFVLVVGGLGLHAVSARAQVARPVGDFRQARWGMTQEEVLATEQQRPSGISSSKGETLLRYDTIAFNLVYVFANGKLARAKYIDKQTHEDPQDFIADFAATEARLQETFGKASLDRAIWESDLYQQERLPYLEQDRAHASDILPSDKNTGLSVSLGYLKMYTERNSARTGVIHSLTGADSRIDHRIEYRSSISAAAQSANTASEPSIHPDTSASPHRPRLPAE